jgi:SPP1 gp7 family putative phage head morphogenesis protein
MAQMLTALDAIVTEGFKSSYNDFSVSLIALAKAEAEYGVTILERYVPFAVTWSVPSASQLRAIVMSRPMQGRLLKDWYAGLSDSTRLGVRRVIQIGITEGNTLEEIVRSIRGTSRNNYEDGVLGASRRQVESVVRTAVNHTQAYARESTYKENDDLIEGVQYVATLDSRTTIICASLDGKVFNIGEGPRPPQHINCRSTTIPVMKEVSAYANIPPAERAALGGPVPGSLTYEDWLRRQSVAVQNDVLGTKRARLFRSGTPIGKFVNDQNRVLSLAELRSRGLDV